MKARMDVGRIHLKDLDTLSWDEIANLSSDFGKAKIQNNNKIQSTFQFQSFGKENEVEHNNKVTEDSKLKSRSNSKPKVQELIYCEDVCFLIGDIKEKIFVKKDLLIRYSPYFKSKYGKIWERPGLQEVELPLVEMNNFEVFLELIDNQNVDRKLLEKMGIPLDQVVHLLELAKTYLVTSLESGCRQFLQNQLDEHGKASCILVYEELLSVNSDETKLRNAALKLIQSNLQFIAKCDEQLVEISQSLWIKLLQIGERFLLKPLSEIELVSIVMRWGKLQCNAHDLPVTSENLQVFLKDILPLIRFYRMTMQEVLGLRDPFQLLEERRQHHIKVETFHETRFPQIGIQSEKSHHHFEQQLDDLLCALNI